MDAIAEVNGQASMAYVGETPWHGKGQILTAGASIEEWTKAAGLDYKVALSPVRFMVKGDGRVFRGKSVIYREDTGTPFAAVSDKYRPVQPSEVMGFFKDLAERGDFNLETAGALFEGQKIWALAQVGQEARVKDDVIRPYCLLATSYDGSLATTAKFTSVRVVCQNTLSASLHNGADKAVVKVRHNTVFKPEQVRKHLGIQEDSWRLFKAQVKALADAKLTSVTAETWLEALLRDVYKAVEPRKGRMFGEILELYNGKAIGADQDATKGTAWGLVNAVTEYVDWQGSKTQDARLNSAWFGLGGDLKDEAFERAVRQLAV